MDNQWYFAYEWVCYQRRHAPPNADIWHLRWIWPEVKNALYASVLHGEYRLSPMQLIPQGNKQTGTVLWSASDALILKWVALHIEQYLPQRKSCMHLRGRGVRKSLNFVSEAITSGHYRFVHRTDIRGYYEHIIKAQVISLVNRFVKNEVHRSLVKQYVYYSIEYGGEFHTPQYGIPRGCALSPLIGGTLLRHIDGYFESLPTENIYYARYMDDFLLFTRSRWHLRRQICILAEFFNCSGFERHPDKTQTGKITNGFDWLGIWFGADGPSIAPRALENHRERQMRLYEQVRRAGKTPAEIEMRMQMYEARWRKWADSILVAAGCNDRSTEKNDKASAR